MVSRLSSEHRTEEQPYDAVIVGAGSAGLMAAWTLGSAGWKTLLLERHRELPRSVCGEYLSSAGVRVVRDAGLAETLVGYAPVRGMRLVSPGGRVVRCHFPAGSPGGVSLDKRRFHEALLARVRSVGVSVVLGGTAKVSESRSTLGAEAWRVSYEAGGFGAVARTPLLLGADGRRSTIARAVGLEREPGRHAADRIAIRGFVSFVDEPERLGEMHVLPGGAYVGVNPVRREEVNVSLVCDAARVKAGGGPERTLADHLERATDLRRRMQPGSLREVRGVTPISSRVRATVGPGVALIGDAGGFVDPLTGEGITIALGTGRSAAQAVIDGERRGEPLPRSLGRYARDRRDRYRAKAWVSHAFQWVIRRPWMCEEVGRFLASDEHRRRGFIGLVGNDYTPLQGLLAMCGLNPSISSTAASHPGTR